MTATLKDLHKRVEAAEMDREQWIRKQRVLVEQRRGVPREKRVPWPGANNDNWPLIDAVMRRWKPNIMSLVLDSDPVCYFFATKADDVEAAGSAQTFYHWKFFQLPSVRTEVMRLADMVAQHGMAYTRQGWDYKTTRRCRIIASKKIFPQGPEAAHQEVVAQLQSQNAQIQQARAAGQPAPEPMPIPDLVTFVQETLKNQYRLDEKDQDHRGQSALAECADQIIQGDEYVKLYYQIIEKDNVCWKAISPLDVVVPPDDCPAQEAPWVSVLYRMTESDIRDMVAAEKFDPAMAEEVIKRIPQGRLGETDETKGFVASHANSRVGIVTSLEAMEGTSHREISAEPARVPIWEIYAKVDLDGTGVLRPAIIWYAPEIQQALSIVEYPYPFMNWPIVRFEFEHTNGRPYSSRGIAELLSTFQKQTNKMHNARLDAIQVLLAPMFKMRAVNGEIQRNIQFRPGTIIPVTDPNDLQPLMQDFRPLTEFFREEQLTKQLAEQFIGVFDQTITDLSGNGSERRTAAEVNAVTAQISSVFGQDATLFQNSMAEVHKQLWQLWLDFGPDEEYFQVLGEDVPRKIRKCDIDRNFDIVPAGTPGNTNKALALARAREMLQYFGADMTGLIDKRALYKAYLDQTDRNLAKRLLHSQEEATLIQQTMALVQKAGQEPAPPP